MSISLNQAQLNSFNNLVNAGNYPAAYNHLAGIAENTPGADSRVANWLKVAARINANDGSFYSEFVRAATKKAGEDMGKPITDKRFQEASDGLAKELFRSISEEGSIPNIDSIIDKDVNTVVRDLKLNPEGWAGTLFGKAPTWMGGLGLDDNSDFYKRLRQDLEDRGVDSCVERLALLGDLVEYNAAGLAAGAEVLLDELWTEINEFYENLWLVRLGRLIGQILPYVINAWWNQAKSWVLPRRDPLALDLDGDGIETRGADGRVLFDHDGDGVKNGTGWVQSDDGLLVLDRNKNGTIDNGGELFGVDTTKSDGKKATDGFDALSDLDSNDDGVFDAKDTRFADVRVWRDLNQDGVSQSKELSTLSANNIRAISLSKTSKTTNLGNGNTQTATATFTRTDDTTGTVANLGLAGNTFYRRFTNRVTLTDKAKKLPEVNGSGAVRNLREAMSGSTALTKLVTTYAKQTSYAKQRAQLDGLVKAWADTSAHNSSIEEATAKGFDLIYMIPGQTAAHFARSAITMTDNSNGNNSSTTTTTLTAEETRRRRALMTEQGKIKKMIATLEAFNGNRFVTVNKDHVTTGAGARIMTTRPATGNSGNMTVGRRTPRAFVSLSAQQITLLKQSYEQLKASVYVSLLKQTRLKAYSDKISVTVDKAGKIALDFTALNTLLTTRRGKKSVETLGDLIELARYLGPALAAKGWDGFTTLKTWVSEADGKAAQEKVLTDLGVKSGNANAKGTDKAEIFYDGGKGNTINAGGGHDIVFGGGGNDRLNGEGLAMPPLWALRRKPELGRARAGQ